MTKANNLSIVISAILCFHTMMTIIFFTMNFYHLLIIIFHLFFFFVFMLDDIFFLISQYTTFFCVCAEQPRNESRLIRHLRSRKIAFQYHNCNASTNENVFFSSFTLLGDLFFHNSFLFCGY